MSTTDKLHRELDKRGIKWFVTPRGSTSFTSPVLGRVFVWENSDGGFALDAGYAPMTLEQLIAATLGRGTCRMPETRIDHGRIEYNGVTEWRRCSSCGAEVLAYPANHCPNCGARVEVRS